MKNIIGVSFRVGEGDKCISVHVGNTFVFFHGTYEQIRDFAREIASAADATQADDILEASK